MAVDLGNAFNYFNLNEDVGIPATSVAQETLANNDLSKAVPILASEDIAARNVGAPQDNRFTGIMRNFARPLMFQGGAKAGLTLGKMATGAASIPLALAGGIASQFLPLDRSKPDMDYQYSFDTFLLNLLNQKHFQNFYLQGHLL